MWGWDTSGQRGVQQLWRHWENYVKADEDPDTNHCCYCTYGMYGNISKYKSHGKKKKGKKAGIFNTYWWINIFLGKCEWCCGKSEAVEPISEPMEMLQPQRILRAVPSPCPDKLWHPSFHQPGRNELSRVSCLGDRDWKPQAESGCEWSLWDQDDIT